MKEPESGNATTVNIEQKYIEPARREHGTCWSAPRPSSGLRGADGIRESGWPHGEYRGNHGDTKLKLVRENVPQADLQFS